MSRGLMLVRYVLPAVIVLTGVVVLLVNGASETTLEGAALLAGAGLSVYLINALFRMGAAGDADRDKEEEARRYFDEHGRWPDQAA